MNGRKPLWLLAVAAVLAACSGKIRDKKPEEAKGPLFSPEELVVKDSIDKVILPILKKLPPMIGFRVSAPGKDPDAGNDTPLAVKSFLDVTDSLALVFLSDHFHSSHIPSLITMLDHDEYAWNANAILYHITGSNAMHMKAYQNDNEHTLADWQSEQKASDIRMWKSRLKTYNGLIR